MIKTNKFVKRIKDYKKCMRLLECANCVYLDEIYNFEFKRISKYNKSKSIYKKVIYDFRLVNKLIDEEDLLNAAIILRTLYENIMYIIVKAYDKKMNITLDILPIHLRTILVDKCEEIFTDYFDKKDFTNIYNYLCKIVHPSSMKELLSYMERTNKYKNYLLGNLKYIMLVIEYMYLNFLNKKIGNEESKFDRNFIDLCTYINLMNISYFCDEMKNKKNIVKRYFCYDLNNKYIKDNQEMLKDVCEIFVNKKELIEEDIKELTKVLDTQIRESKYNEIISKILTVK